MELRESNLSFTFDDHSWEDVIQYDSTTDYRNIKHAISGTKAVDFIGIFKRDTLSLIEIKNFRRHRIENKTRVKDGELADELAQKVRDTLSGIMGGARNSTHMQSTWKKYVRMLLEKEVHIVCWVEEDRHANTSHTDLKRNKSSSSALNQVIKSKLSWLTTKVMVANTANNPYKDTLQVSFINPDTV